MFRKCADVFSFDFADFHHETEIARDSCTFGRFQASCVNTLKALAETASL